MLLRPDHYSLSTQFIDYSFQSKQKSLLVIDTFSYHFIYFKPLPLFLILYITALHQPLISKRNELLSSSSTTAHFRFEDFSLRKGLKHNPKIFKNESQSWAKNSIRRACQYCPNFQLQPKPR